MGQLINQPSEYPLVMCHPHHRPATMKLVPRTKMGTDQPGAVIHDSISTPEYLPNVTVIDRDEEMRYQAQGYSRAGMYDPAAYAAAVSGAPAAGGEFHAYPKWKYHLTLDACVVNSKDEEKALGPGWADRPDLVKTMDVKTAPAPQAEPKVTGRAATSTSKTATKKKKKARRPMSPEMKAKLSELMKARQAAKKQAQQETA